MSIRSLPKELEKKAVNDLNEVPGRVEEDLKYIRDWLSKQPHINARTDDQWLLSFLRGCKFSLERTKEKLDSFYTMRSLVPEFFADRDPFLPEIQEILSKGCFWVPLPKTADPGAPRVLVMETSNLDHEKMHVINVMKVNLMILDILLNEDDNFIVAGFHIIQDMNNMGMGNVLQMTPGFLRKTTLCFHRAYPGRPKGFHIINAPSVSEILFNVLNGLPSEKTKGRMNVRSTNDCTDLDDDIVQALLPKELGGDCGSLQNVIDEWKKKIESYQNWFKEDLQYRTNEKKRPGKPKTSSDVFGLDGSFRKLDID